MHEAALALEYLPASQVVQTDCPAGAKVPAVQSVHATLVEYLPASQVMHEAALALEYLPASQVVQTDCPAGAKVPAVQSEHASADVAYRVVENLPASQSVQKYDP